MKSFKNLLMLIALVFVASCGKSTSFNPQLEEAATKAALAWLELIDNGKYAESWEQTAVIFQKAVPKENRVKTLEALRAPHGKNESRELANREYMDSLPNVPKGDYVVIQFKADFTNKKGVIETITPMLENGEWKVSGYYIK